MAKKKSGEHNPKTEGGADSVRGNLAALIIEVQNTNKQLESDSTVMDVQTRALTNINDVIVDVYQDIRSIAEAIAGNRLKELEDAKERNKQMEDLLEALKKKETPPKEQKKGDFSWLGLAAALVTGLVMGGLNFIKNYIKAIQTTLSALAKALKVDGIIAKMFATIKNGFTFILDIVKGGFSKAWSFISGLFKGGMFTAIADFFTGVGKAIMRVFNLGDLGKDFAALWSSIKGMWEMMGKPLKFLGNIFGGGGGGLLSYFDDLLKFFQPLTKFFGALGSILGKLALPLQVIMSIFDTVSGAMDGWNKTEGTFMDKLFGAIKGGLTGLLNGLIGGLLDLLKDGLSFILEFFGMKDAAAWLDSFKFTDMITNMVTSIFDFIKGIITGVVDFFKKSPAQMMESLANAMTYVADAAKNVLKSLLRMVLPDPSKGVAQKLASKAIPDAVYEFAGMDPKTGAIKEEAPAPAPTTAPPAQALPQAQQVNTQAQAGLQEAAAMAQAEGTKLNLRPSLQRPQGGGTAPAVPISSSTTKWDPEDAMGRGMYVGA